MWGVVHHPNSLLWSRQSNSTQLLLMLRSVFGILRWVLFSTLSHSWDINSINVLLLHWVGTLVYILCKHYLVYCLCRQLILSTQPTKNPLLWFKNMLTFIFSKLIYRLFLIRSSSWIHIHLECFLCSNDDLWPDLNIPSWIYCAQEVHIGSTSKVDSELSKLNSRLHYPSDHRPNL